jgi:hypothetical protein
VYGDYGSLNYGIKRLVPSGLNHLEPPLAPAVKRSIVSNDFGSLTYGLKRLVPSGPNG